MLVVVSPAKTMDFESPLPTSHYTQPELLGQSKALIDVMKRYSVDDVVQLMGVSEKIAKLNVERFEQWAHPFTPKNARPAIFAFKGDVYTGLQAYDLSAKDLEFAQQHLRILSGLYGVLRPLDLMQAYRLEMGRKFDTGKGKSLYEFWGEQITDQLNAQLAEHPQKTLINLASNEYFRSVNKKVLEANIITPQFKDWKNDRYKMISFFAKKARGMMARYITQHKIVQAEDIKAFNVDGYNYNEGLSSSDDWVFTRKQSA
jgi:cytoplasmic iron level regulating protein YaaA (DUF328/UPF0246 family)